MKHFTSLSGAPSKAFVRSLHHGPPPGERCRHCGYPHASRCESCFICGYPDLIGTFLEVLSKEDEGPAKAAGALAVMVVACGLVVMLAVVAL